MQLNIELGNLKAELHSNGTPEPENSTPIKAEISETEMTLSKEASATRDSDFFSWRRTNIDSTLNTDDELARFETEYAEVLTNNVTAILEDLDFLKRKNGNAGEYSMDEWTGLISNLNEINSDLNSSLENIQTFVGDSSALNDCIRCTSIISEALTKCKYYLAVHLF